MQTGPSEADVFEKSDSYIYIATERLVPLRWHVKRKSLSPETAKWGLYSVAVCPPPPQTVCQHREKSGTADAELQRTVKFINDEAASVHGNLKVASVYTTESGEWKLGGFEVLSNVKDDEAVIYVSCGSPS